MRVREVFFNDFRSFRGQKRISFVDPLTDAVRPLTVLAGTNGSGKTTILDTIEALLSFATDLVPSTTVTAEVQDTGFAGMSLEISRTDLPASSVFATRQEPASSKPSIRTAVMVGLKRLVPTELEAEWPNQVFRLADLLGAAQGSYAAFVVDLQLHVAGMMSGSVKMQGGLLYFPSDRYLDRLKGGPVEPPPDKPEWLFRYCTPDGWKGSLEQLWVWQNYLDLEEGKEGRAHLKSFVETVEDILGPDRRITVREGRVRVPVGWTNGGGERPLVRLDQLPSGERSVLLLFGELARRRRPGTIILIDEPELSLHPTMQRLVVHRLREFAREWDSQVILATHSLEILRAAHESERIILDQLDAPPTPQEEEDACVPTDR